MLQLTDIKKYYHSQLALQVDALKLENGAYFIKGANGSGKTTFLKMIAGLLPFEGNILLNNINLKREPVAYRQQISWAETEPLYPSFLAGIELIRLYGAIRKVRKQEINYLVAQYNIGSYINDAIGTYSAGMIKKLSLVAAFLGNTRLILLDEPFITLDADAYNTTWSLIAERIEKEGTGFLISSHLETGDKPVKENTLFVHNKTVVLQ